MEAHPPDPTLEPSVTTSPAPTDARHPSIASDDRVTDDPEAGGSRPLRPLVVVGVDDSAGARAAVAWALPEAVARGADVQLVATFPIDYYWAAPYMLEPTQLEEIRRDVARRARRVLDEVVAELVAAGSHGVAELTVEVLVEAGSPALELVERSRGAALLVVGSRGRGAVRSLLLGSVALHCTGHAHCPVVVVPAGAVLADRSVRSRVVVGVDGSPVSAAGLLAAIAQAGRTDADVEVVAAYDSIDTWTPESLPPRSTAELHGLAVASAERMLTEVRQAAAEQNLPEVPLTLTVVAGRAGGVLVDRAAGARLLVVGTHGAGQLKGLVLGSVALHCVLHAPCPVLLQREGDPVGAGRPPVAHLTATVPA